MNKTRAPRNRTLVLTEKEKTKFNKNLIQLKKKATVDKIINKTICQDIFAVTENLPEKFIDLLIIDPPYNLDKAFKSTKFNKKTVDEYTEWLDNIIQKLIPTLKETSTIYVCGDWLSSTSIHLVLSKYFIVRNRITWEREKGRGAKTNWKNNSEDIWFCTMSNEYTFNLDDVKLKKKVIAPYKDENGKPKDWNEEDGFRLTHPSNIWTDISIPFWSMPENTEHPTQKPEKLIAKLILASSNKGDIVFDPFAGSGTTAIAAKKLERNYLTVEIDKDYACLIEKRLELANDDTSIQGYFGQVFWERNSLNNKLSK